MKKFYILSFLLIVFSFRIFGSEKIKNNEIKNITAFTEIFGVGQKLTGLILEYSDEIDNKKLSKSTFEVLNRNIVKIYTNDIPEKTTTPKNGKYIIIELSSEDENSEIFTRKMRGQHRDKKVSFVQKEKVFKTNGDEIPPNSVTLTNNNSRDLIVEDFKQFEYGDLKTGILMKYNLYIPKNYDKNKKYPLIIFIHDAGPVGQSDTKVALLQGNGAIVFASPEEQKKHEAFVLAPKYSITVVNDNHEVTDDLEATVNLINYLTEKYSIDRNRLYTTGQSMGAMMSIVMNIRYPNLFAASYLVAGQWDEKVVAPMAKNNIWITVSTGDTKAFPGMNAITEVLKNNGGKVAYASWKGTYTSEKFTTEVENILKEKANINYTTLEKGTVIPQNIIDNSKGGEHIYTWSIAYDIEGIRDWLFNQKKNSEKE